MALRPIASQSTQRQAGDGADVVLELAGARALDRPVPRVVDARRDLVGQQAVADREQLERQHADVVQPLEQQPRRSRLGQLLRARVVRSAPGPASGGGCPRGGGSRRAGSSRVRRRAAAHRDHRQLAVERHQRSRDQRHAAAARRPGGVDVRALASDELPLAVVAAAPRLERRRAAELAQRVEVGQRVDGREARRSGCPARRNSVFSCERGPGRRASAVGGGMHRDCRREPAADDAGTFSNSNVTTSGAVGKRVERRWIVVGADDQLADRPRAGVRRGVEEGEAACPADGRPAPACGRAGRRRARRRCISRRRGSGERGTAPVCARGSARAAARSPGACRPTIAAASSAALTAPARPMASVPTGMPAGICTIESSESMPLRAPSTRPARRAPAATSWPRSCPGRWAAPPAPAMITSSPRARARCWRTRTAGRACGAPRRRAPRTARRARRASSAACAHGLPVGRASP